jgi:hypothetical protein
LALDDPGALSETSPYRPRTPYNAAKAGGDHAVRAYFHTHDLPVTITNCSNNYGPYQFPEKVIPLFITRALQGQPLPLYASTRNRREWLHVLDHCRAIDLVLERGTVGETYHVGSGFEANIETIADTVLAELGLPASLKTIVPDRPSRDRRYLLDSSKLQKKLGWAPEVPFPEAMKATVAWYRDNQSWWQPLLDRPAFGIAVQARSRSLPALSGPATDPYDLKGANSDVAFDLLVRARPRLGSLRPLLLTPSEAVLGAIELAYLAVCRSIQLLVRLARGDAGKTSRFSSCAISSRCCVARRHAPGSSPPTGPCSQRSAASYRDHAGRASSCSPRRCCAGTGGWSPAPGPTRTARSAAHHSTRTYSS